MKTTDSKIKQLFLFCEDKEKDFEIITGKKSFFVCKKCLNEFYKEIGKLVLSKSPESILKKDNMIKRERF